MNENEILGGRMISIFSVVSALRLVLTSCVPYTKISG